MAAPRDFRELIALWPSRAEFGADTGKSTGHVQQWHFRNSISPAHWPLIVAGADQRGIPGITLEVLAMLAAKRRQPQPEGAAA